MRLRGGGRALLAHVRAGPVLRVRPLALHVHRHPCFITHGCSCGCGGGGWLLWPAQARPPAGGVVMMMQAGLAPYSLCSCCSGARSGRSRRPAEARKALGRRPLTPVAAVPVFMVACRCGGQQSGHPVGPNQALRLPVTLFHAPTLILQQPPPRKRCGCA